MANGMWDLTGWHILTPEESAQWEEEARQHEAERLKRWPLSQRRHRCMNCGAFMPKNTTWYTRCKVCDESYDSLQ